jgi:hypothetical protein
MIETTISVQATKVCHLNLASRATDEFLKKKLSNFMPNDPLKELEEWAKEHMKEWEWIRDYSSEYREKNVWAEAKASSYKVLLAKIAEMREVDM